VGEWVGVRVCILTAPRLLLWALHDIAAANIGLTLYGVWHTQGGSGGGRILRIAVVGQ